jgi:hypothetical protein
MEKEGAADEERRLYFETSWGSEILDILLLQICLPYEQRTNVNAKSLTRYTLLASGSRHDSTFTIWDVAQGMAIYWISLYFGSCH